MSSADKRDFTVCGRCHALRGPIGSVGAVQVRQLCDCATKDERAAQPRLGDHNTAFELCCYCGTEALTSGSRWSVWFCEDCKDRIRTLNQRSGRCVIPIGRHSLMNGVFFDPGADEASRAFADQLKRLFEQTGGTKGWARAVARLNLAAAGLPTGHDIGLESYLDTVATIAPVKEQHFTQMVQHCRGRPVRRQRSGDAGRPGMRSSSHTAGALTDPAELRVSLADELHNLRSLAADRSRSICTMRACTRWP